MCRPKSGRNGTIRSCSAAVYGAARLLSLVVFLLLPGAARAEARHSSTHLVHSGQRLGSIAKRYGVTIEALSLANRIKATDPIRPGQKLLIPSRNNQMGPEEAGAPARFLTHRVKSGQRLESIARRYRVSVRALCAANRIQARTPIRPGQALTIPGVLPESKPRASLIRSGASYRSYFRTPRSKGRVELIGYSEKFRGHVFDKKGRLLPGARQGIERVLSATGHRPDPDRRLIQLLVVVSDRFGGRPLRIVSGYRTSSFFEDSRHKESRAVDFSIPGVPNDALRDYLRTLSNVGVGYYPNSSFVHLDVRAYAAYWVDYSGPGEMPRSRALAKNITPDARTEDASSPWKDAGIAGTETNLPTSVGVSSAAITEPEPQIEPTRTPPVLLKRGRLNPARP